MKLSKVFDLSTAVFVHSSNIIGGVKFHPNSDREEEKIIHNFDMGIVQVLFGFLNTKTLVDINIADREKDFADKNCPFILPAGTEINQVSIVDNYLNLNFLPYKEGELPERGPFGWSVNLEFKNVAIDYSTCESFYDDMDVDVDGGFFWLRC